MITLIAFHCNGKKYCKTPNWQPTISFLLQEGVKTVKTVDHSKYIAEPRRKFIRLSLVRDFKPPPPKNWKAPPPSLPLKIGRANKQCFAF
jgi:hypothetical protein